MTTRRIAVALAVLLTFTSSLSAATWHKTVSAAQAEAKQKDRIIFVDLFAEWCGWCHRMEREVFPAEAFQKATRNMVLLRVDTEDKGEGTKLARDFQITKLPTFLMLAPDGMLVGTIYGYAPAEAFAKRVQETEARYQAFKKEAASEQTFRTDYKRRLDLAVVFISRRGYEQADKRLRALSMEKAAPKDVLDGVYYHLAVNLYMQRKLDQSLAALKTLLARSPAGDSLERGKILLGQIYFEQGKYTAALTELRNFKRDFPASSLIASVDSLIPVVENAAARPR